ncbi:unnamed protein product [Mesocestoides corti]|uniref:Transmembrane protein n=1 Tax=Mesocestoides corti TaxID=53468 RepID=A0A0R3U273_MESCO|nr:unnamed protein product [Mesocestoides corti]
MELKIKYVIALLVILLFTCLAVGLDINICGPLFSSNCRSDKVYKQMTGLIATALALFIIGVLLSTVSLRKRKRWISICEFIAVALGAIMLLAALCLFYKGKHFWAPLMAGVAMTLAMETAVFMLIDMMA